MISRIKLVSNILVALRTKGIGLWNLGLSYQDGELSSSRRILGTINFVALEFSLF